VIGASACLWYFEVNTDTKGRGTVNRAYWIAFRYHLGSVAFGSFLIAVCQMIRLLFEYYRKKMGTMAKDIPWVKVALILTGWLLWLMEHCVKYIAKLAYIQVALTNEHFCKSAWNGFTLMIKHAIRFGMGASIGKIFLVFGMLLIGVLNATIAYYVISNYPALQVTQAIPPAVCCGIIGGIVGMLFLSIFSFSSDAIFMSFLLDEELGFDGDARPDNMKEFAEEMKRRGRGGCDCC